MVPCLLFFGLEGRYKGGMESINKGIGISGLHIFSTVVNIFGHIVYVPSFNLIIFSVFYG